MSHPDPAMFGSSPVEEPMLGRSDRGQILLAAFISGLLPGLGHLSLHRQRRGLLLLTIFGALLVGLWPLRMEANPATLLGLTVAMVALCIFAAWDAGYGNHSAPKISHGWLVVLLPFALVGAVGHMNWSTRAAGFQSFEIPSRSMENGVMMGDRIIVDRRYYEKNPPRDGDIAILMNPQGEFVIKRIVAQGGETIEGHDGKVFLNGKLLNEPYVFHSGPMLPEQSEFGPLAVPAGKLFVMGDNRDISLDSRSATMGPLDIGSLRGKALYSIRSTKNATLSSLK